MPRVLLLLPTTSYRTADFLEAADRLGVDVTVASDRPSTVEGLAPAGFLTLDFRDPSSCARLAAEFASRHPVAAVVPSDDDTAVAAAAIGEALGLPRNSLEAALAARHKPTMRDRLAAGGVPSPRYRLFHLEDEARAVSASVPYPAVLKPTFLAASRGVIRADTPAEFRIAWDRISRILGSPEVAARGGPAAREILVEDFVGGPELALEGLLRSGTLEVLALFDKPDPLDGPFFEETIYVTPSRLPAGDQRAVAGVAAEAARALGLLEGPIHAELRWTSTGPVVLEVAARSIGGLCSRTLRFGAGLSLDELILRHALGDRIPAPPREGSAAGVMMIPIPSAGVLEEVGGTAEARSVPGIAEVTISAHVGQRLVPLPEGSRYLGFLFSRADSPGAAETALRKAHGHLRFRIAPEGTGEEPYFAAE